MPTFSGLPAASSLAPTDRFPLDHDNGDGTFSTQRATGAQLAALASGAASPLSVTLNWAGGTTVVAGTYLFTGTAAYPFTVTSLDASVGTAGGTITAQVRNAGATVGGLGAAAISAAGKTNFPASGANRAVAAGATVDVVLTVTGTPTNAFLTLNGVKT